MNKQTMYEYIKYVLVAKAFFVLFLVISPNNNEAPIKRKLT